MLKINTIIIIAATFFGSLSCTYKKHATVYIYGTSEFENKQKELTYSLNEAVKLCADYILKNEELSDSMFLRLDILYGDYYIFKAKPLVYNLKLAEYSLSGFWVNGRTGDINFIENMGSVRVVLEYNKHKPFMYNLRSSSQHQDKEIDRTTDCDTLSGEMMSGVECIEYNTNMEKVYEKIVLEKLVEDSEYMESKLPDSDCFAKALKNEILDINYLIKPDTVVIEMLYPGGITQIELMQRSKDVIRRITYNAD